MSKWKAIQPESAAGWWVIADSAGVDIGSGDGGYSRDEAMLMAAAPEMLEALKAMREAFKNVTLADDELLANQLAASVIAKAEGKSNG